MPSQQFQEILEMIRERVRAAQEKPPTLAEARAGSEARGQNFQDLTGVTTEPVDAGGVPAEWVTAHDADPGKVIPYLHGGGYVVGSIVSHRGTAAGLSKSSGSRTLILDYRLAPENPFPAAVEDAVAAYRWLTVNGTDPANITIAGDSAGGGLAIAAMLSLRDAGDPLPSAGVCLSPWVDMEATSESMDTRSHLDPMLRREGLIAFANQYMAGQDPKNPLASPIHADLKGLPPLLVLVGTAEVLYDDATGITEKARAAGVEVTFEAWEDMVHVWHGYAPFLPEGQQSLDRIGEFVRQHVGAGVA